MQRRGGPIEVIRSGDRVFFEPGEDHWHGAAPDRFITRIAMQEVDQGSPVTWGEHVRAPRKHPNIRELRQGEVHGAVKICTAPPR